MHLKLGSELKINSQGCYKKILIFSYSETCFVIPIINIITIKVAYRFEYYYDHLATYWLLCVCYLLTYSMAQHPLKSLDRPLMRVSSSNSILVTFIFY